MFKFWDQKCFAGLFLIWNFKKNCATYIINMLELSLLTALPLPLTRERQYKALCTKSDTNTNFQRFLLISNQRCRHDSSKHLRLRALQQ